MCPTVGLALLLHAAALPAFPETLAPDAYTDGTLGFSLRLPRDWRVDRRRRPDPAGVILLQLYREFGPSQVHDITVRVSQTPQPRPLDQVLDELLAKVNDDLKNVKIVSRTPREVSKRSAADVSATYTLDGEERFMALRLIQAWPQQYYVILFNGPRAAALDIEPLFRQVADSFRVIEDPATNHVIRQALADGRAWFTEITRKSLADMADAQWCLMIHADGAPIGFVESLTMDFEYGGRRGLGLTERGWTFPPDGAARKLHNEMWLRYDGRAERWQAATRFIVAARGDRPASIDIVVEEGARENDQLVTSQIVGYGQPSESNPVIPAPPGYIPRLVVRMFPRLVGDLVTPRVLAFNEYDFERRGLILRTFDMKGQVETPGGDGKDPIFRIREREGFATDLADVYVDRLGRIVSVSSGKLTFKPARPEAAYRLFATRIEQAEKTLRELEADYSRVQDRFSLDEAQPPPPRRKP